MGSVLERCGPKISKTKFGYMLRGHVQMTSVLRGRGDSLFLTIGREVACVYTVNHDRVRGSKF